MSDRKDQMRREAERRETEAGAEGKGREKQGKSKGREGRERRAEELTSAVCIHVDLGIDLGRSLTFDLRSAQRAHVSSTTDTQSHQG